MSIESPFEGCVDGIEDGWILGWARKTTAASERIEVAVIVDGMTVGEAIANLFRADLAQAGKGDGHHAFEFQLPRLSSDEHEIRVVYRASGSDLWGSPLRALVGPSLHDSGTTKLPVAYASHFGGFWTDLPSATAIISGKLALRLDLGG